MHNRVIMFLVSLGNNNVSIVEFEMNLEYLKIDFVAAKPKCYKL
jgi:hypothetical protein